jgi:serine protease AprX
MRRILVVLALLLTFGGLLEAQPGKLDSALQRKLRDLHANGNSGPSSGQGNGLRVRVIIQTNGDPDKTGVSDYVRKRGGNVSHKFVSFPGIVADLPLAEVANAAAQSAVTKVSFDDRMSSFGSNSTNWLSNIDVNRVVTGAPQAWLQYNVDGTGIGVAVIDSGVTSSSDVTTKKDVDFTTKGGTGDSYGHGTHVAGIIGGSGALSNYRFIGDAPNVNLVNLRVLDQDGNGYVSDVIEAIEWAVQNRNALGKDNRPLNIRVINLSLGHIPYESAVTDPLAIACRKAVMAGIVVVAAAGNYGKDSAGNIVYGGITSPGTEPSVITVGAVSTFNTLSRSDDTVASYSSRGPSIDGLMKPDIAAPGTGIVAPMANNARLAKTYPQLIYNQYYMKLSGTSMSTAFVSAAAALVLQKNPGLTPNAVKAVLMYTAERRGQNPLEMGAGYLNALGALNLASNINAYAARSTYWLQNNGVGLSYKDDISGYRAVWGGTIVWDDALYSGTSINYNQKAWGSTIVWGDTIVWEDMEVVFGNTIVWESDVNALSVIVKSDTIVWDDGLDALSLEAKMANVAW